MTVQNPPLKAVVSVAEMARLVSLSRARFYQLVEGGVFPPPVYDVRTRRPLYTAEMQQVCLDVRRSNRGVNGQPILFYCRVPVPARPAKPRPAEHTPLAEALKALGLSAVTPAQVAAAVRREFPGGTTHVNEQEVLRRVFLRLQASGSGG